MTTAETTILYHEVAPEDVADILARGIAKTSRGEKGSDRLIRKTDQLLDDLRPEGLKVKGISRDDNIYAYFTYEDIVIDIKDGNPVPVNDFIKASDQAVVELSVDEARCYVSDLDVYDAMKDAVSGGNDASARTLAKRYWEQLIPLVIFEPGLIIRPEVMITYDVPSENVRAVT